MKSDTPFTRRQMMAAGGAVVAASAVLGGCQSARPATAGAPEPRSGVGMPADSVIARWPSTPQQVARQTMAKYGPPSGVTQAMLLWEDTGPWKQTVVYRDEVPHNFPMPHTDLLEQVVDYQVPVELFATLARYDGSVIIERTKGTMAARCDGDGLQAGPEGPLHAEAPLRDPKRRHGGSRQGDRLA